MNEKINLQCQFCVEGKCYVNSMTSPEDYDMHVPACHNCPAPVIKKKS